MAASLKDKRIGETRMQNCGLEAKIKQIENIRIQRMRCRRIGEKHIQNCGLEAEIVSYRSSRDIDVKFPDGRIVKHKTYVGFINGHIIHPETFAKKHLNKKHIQNCGLEAKIVGYRNRRDIDIQFPDGMIVEHKTCDAFMKGLIKHPTINGNFNTHIKKIYPLAKSKIYHTQIHGIACVTNDIYYYYCHCPICLAHEIWTFDEIREHKCNHRLVQEREKLIKARSGVPAA